VSKTKVRIQTAKIHNPQTNDKYSIYTLETQGGKTLPHGSVSSMKQIDKIVKENNYLIVK